MGDKKEKLDSRKTEMVVPKAEVASLFKVLGEGLECGCLTYAGQQIDLARLKGLKVGIKDQGDSFAVKLKFKMAEAEEPAAE